MTRAVLSKILSQAKNTTTYNLARTGMRWQRTKDTDFEIFHGHTLLRFSKTARLAPAAAKNHRSLNRGRNVNGTESCKDRHRLPQRSS